MGIEERGATGADTVRSFVGQPWARGGVRAALGLLVIALLATPIHADLFRLKDGTRLEGTIVREIGDLVSIKPPDGVVTIDKSEIKERIEKKTPFKEYQEKIKTLDSEDLDSQVELARWCERNSLSAEAARHWKRVIEIAPDHEDARKTLGYIWLAGDWYLEGSPEEAARRAELEAMDTDDLIELPEKVTLPPPEIDRKPLPPLPTTARSVALVIDEKMGRKKPTTSGASYSLSSLCRQLKEPLSASTGKDPKTAPFVMELKVKVYFVRTVTFYGRPLNNMFQGQVNLTIKERTAEGSLRVVDRLSFNHKYSLTTRIEKDQAIQSAYHATIHEFRQKLPTMRFFKSRGAPQPGKKGRN